MVQCQVDISQCLCLNPLRRIHHQNGAVACRQRTADFIVKIHMAGCIYQIKNIFIAILGIVDNTHRLCLNRNTAFPLQFHIVQNLSLHLPAGQQPCLLYDPVRQR